MIYDLIDRGSLESIFWNADEKLIEFSEFSRGSEAQHKNSCIIAKACSLIIIEQNSQQIENNFVFINCISEEVVCNRRPVIIVHIQFLRGHHHLEAERENKRAQTKWIESKNSDENCFAPLELFVDGDFTDVCILMIFFVFCLNQILIFFPSFSPSPLFISLFYVLLANFKLENWGVGEGRRGKS